MILDGSQRERLHAALLSGFDRAALTLLVSFELNEEIDSIAGNGEMSLVTLKLIQWCEKNAKLTQLVQGAYAKRPQHEEIKHCCLQFCNSVESSTPSKTSLSQLFPEAYEFDMDGLMNSCLSEIYTKQGLVGLVIPCAEESFRVRFCERLKKELGRKNIVIKDPLQISPYSSIDYVVNSIARYEKELMRNRDVICPVPINIFDPASSVPDTFWKAIAGKFKDKPFQSRLVIFMYGIEKAIFPQGPVQLCPPSFQSVHSLRWIIKIAELADWPESTRNVWHQKMVMECKVDGHEDLLDLRGVYEHLDWSLGQFQQNISADDFLQKLETRS